MIENKNVIRSSEFENVRRRRMREKDIEESQKIPEAYKYEINAFRNFCDETEQEENFDSMLDFLYVSLVDEQVKISSWNKRMYAIKKYIEFHNLDSYNEEIRNEVKNIRDLYKGEENKDLTKTEGKSHMDKEELLQMIAKLDTRAKAICMVNLVTASRPSEMVRIQIKHIDLDGRNVSIYLKKQKDWFYKRIDLEAVVALQEYIKEYGLTDDDYLVGREDKHGNYTSAEVSEYAYRKMLRRWLGVSPYTLRKTQVTHMHTMGADLKTIASQTGHQDLTTLSEHYLNVPSTTIDKYL